MSTTSVSEDFRGVISMLRAFADCSMFSFIDKIANAASKEVVIEALKDAVRLSKSLYESGSEVCERESGFKVRPYVPSEDEVSRILAKLDENLIEGLELSKKIAILALTHRPSKPQQ